MTEGKAGVRFKPKTVSTLTELYRIDEILKKKIMFIVYLERKYDIVKVSHTTGTLMKTADG